MLLLPLQPILPYTIKRLELLAIGRPRAHAIDTSAFSRHVRKQDAPAYGRHNDTADRLR
jgi:hypothetical protein